MQMTDQQFKLLMDALTQIRGEGAGPTWIHGILALGATLVSVTGVVVGMKAAIKTLADQLSEQANSLRDLTKEVQNMAKELAVVKYATGMTNEKE